MIEPTLVYIVLMVLGNKPQSQVTATRLMNTVISILYNEGFWIKANLARDLGKMLYKFLACYQTLCKESLKRHVNRFSLTPKCHMLAHTAAELVQQSSVAEWAISPLATANQIQEDYIGRPARLSRRVHQLKLHTRVMERSLLNSFEALHGFG